MVADGSTWLAEASAATLDALDRLGEATSTELRATVDLLRGSTVYAPDKAYGGSSPVGPACSPACRRPARSSGRATAPVDQLPAHLGPDGRLAGGARSCRPSARPSRAGAAVARSLRPRHGGGLKWWLGSTDDGDPCRAGRRRRRGGRAGRVGRGRAPRRPRAEDTVVPYARLLPASTHDEGLDRTATGTWGPTATPSSPQRQTAAPTAWWDGRIVGGWAPGTRRRGLPAAARGRRDGRHSCARRGGRPADRLAGTVVGWRRRFPSPLPGGLLGALRPPERAARTEGRAMAGVESTPIEPPMASTTSWEGQADAGALDPGAGGRQALRTGRTGGPVVRRDAGPGVGDADAHHARRPRAARTSTRPCSGYLTAFDSG